MLQPRYHLWLEDGQSLCRLRTISQACAPEHPEDATVCGPCLVAAEVQRRCLAEFLLSRRYPDQSPEEAACELAEGPFGQLIGPDIVRFVNESGYSYPAFAREGAEER